MPVNAPSREITQPTKHDAHGIVRFNRKGFDTSDNKKTDNGKGGGGAPPFGNNGKDGGDNRRFCMNIINKMFDDSGSSEGLFYHFGVTFFELVYKALDMRLRKINSIIKSIAKIDSKINDFTNSGQTNKAKINSINKKHALEELKAAKDAYKSDIYKVKKYDIDLMLGRCRSFLTQEQLDEFIELENSLKDKSDELDKLDLEVKSSLKSNHGISLTPLTVFKSSTKAFKQRTSKNALSNNMPIYANQKLNLPDELFRGINRFVSPKRLTTAQIKQKQRQAQKAEYDRKNRFTGMDGNSYIMKYDLKDKFDNLPRLQLPDPIQLLESAAAIGGAILWGSGGGFQRN